MPAHGPIGRSSRFLVAWMGSQALIGENPLDGLPQVGTGHCGTLAKLGLANRVQAAILVHHAGLS
jgi:hypothetical protein